MNPTQAQLDARLNPTPVNVQMPGQGYFRGVGDYGTTLYQDLGGGKANTFSLSDLGKQSILDSGGTLDGGNSGTFATAGVKALKDKYGIDYNSLNQVNIGDYIQGQNRTYGSTYGSTAGFGFGQGDWNSLTPAQKAQLSTQTINNTPNSAATPEMIAQQMKDPNWNTATAAPFNGGAAPVNTALQLKPGETIAQYNQRIAGMNSAGGTQYFAGSTGPISSSVLSGGSTPSVNYSQAPSLPQYSAAKGLDTNVPQMTMTTQESDLQTRINDLMSLNSQASTKGQYENEQAAAQDIAGKQRLVNDFSSQLKVIQLEAANIQQVTQQGQGVTTAIDQRQRAEALRLNNVKSLGVYAQLEMAKGNLATAQDAVDRAVELKYGPIEAQIKAAQENIDLLQNSPSATLADKNRALVIQASLDARTATIAQQKEDEQRIWEVYVNATENGLTDVTTLNKIKNAATAQEALAIAAGAGVAANQKKPIVSGALSYTQDDISEGYNILKTGKAVGGQSYGNPMGADGFVDPRVYLTMLDQWRQSGGQVDDFLKQYPTTLINPTNTWVGAELQSRQVKWNPVGAASASGDFTDIEKRKLEQAGLTNATRQQQLDALYGDSNDLFNSF
ncbi:MAG: hypothetical protein KBD16_00840 [Candidatus Pacebacteria bacterium]|nr:hypothetical protein [Candidatus Paceibacterota bacterium]